MIAEQLTYDGERYGGANVQRLERVFDVRSAKVTLAKGPDGVQYPRVAISTPSRYSSVGLREDDVFELQLFDDRVHDARGASVCGPGECWLNVVVDRDLHRALDEIAQYRLEGRDVYNISGVVRVALREYLERFDCEQLTDETRKRLRSKGIDSGFEWGRSRD